MANINIFALGGQDENGKDLFVLEVENDIFIINTGIKFPINDRWGIDGIIADTTYLAKRKDRIKGIFLTHAHDESFAALPWLIMDFPGLTIYGSKFTVEAARKRVSKYKIEHSNYKFEIIGEKNFGKVNVKTFEVANSIPGSLAYNFQTPDGDVIAMSNMTIDDLGPYGNTKLEDIKNNSKDILALILDTRRANYNGKSADKKSIKELIKNTFEKTKDDQRIIVGGYDEEMYTIQEVIDMANEHNRPVAFYGSAFDTLYQILLKENPDTNKPKQIVEYKDVNNVNNAVVLVTGTWSRIYQRFVRVASNNDVYLKLRPTDAIVMVTPPINGMEVEYSQMLDEVAKIAPNILSITDKDYYALRPTKDDVLEIVSTLKPKHFIPVSSLYRYQSVAGKQAVKGGVRKDRVVLLPNGKILYLKDGEIASQKGKVPFGDVIIQGFGVGDVSYEVIKERKALSAGGLISIAAQVNRRTKQLVGEINIQIVGVLVKSELKAAQDEINSIMIQKFEEAAKLDYREIQNSIRKRIQKIMSKKINKEPLVVITFYEV